MCKRILKKRKKNLQAFIVSVISSFHEEEEEEGDTSGESKVSVANPPLFQANPKPSTRNICSKAFRPRIRRITLKNHL